MTFHLVADGRRREIESPTLAEACREALRHRCQLLSDGAPVCPLAELGLSRPGLFDAFGPDWASPGPEEIREVMAVARLTGGAAARLVGVDGRTVRKWVGGHREMAYSTWRTLCIYAWLADPERMPCADSL